jgi:dTDP-4-dehydrorhamnose 3,5-epimerase
MTIEFKIEEANLIKGVFIITPSVSIDLRGNIWSSYVQSEIEKLLPGKVNFIHDKFAESKKNVLRGIHGDNKTWKLITCVYGDIFQVIVDLRVKSETYKKWEKFSLNSNNPKLILIPPEMGNAYYVNSDNAVYHYKLAYEGEHFDAKDQYSYMWNDKDIAITWPTNNPILSDRDIS